MTRIARLVIPGIPHHVVQRGNRRQKTFFDMWDRRMYLRLLRELGPAFGVTFWAYCLMDNHVHLIAVPETVAGLASCIGRVHCEYSRRINRRHRWTGYLWQGRFFSAPLEESHLVTAIRYVERNPVRAGLVEQAAEYPWSSARAHVTGEVEPPLTRFFLQDHIGDWASFLGSEDLRSHVEDLRTHTRTGRPLGGEQFVSALEVMTGRSLTKRKTGRPRKRVVCP